MNNFKAVFNAKFSERDNWENGCDPFNSHNVFIADLIFESDNLADLLRVICKYFNVKMDSVMLNSCNELGRIDVQTYTKSLKGNKCTYDKYQEGFKNGDFDMYLNCFVGEVTRPSVLVDLCDKTNFIWG